MVLVHDTLCSRSVRSFNQIALTVFNLQSGQKCIQLCYKGNNLRNYNHAKVMILVHDMSSECALQMYELSLKYLQPLSS